MKNLTKSDPQLATLIKAEQKRQQETLMLIPSENYTSPAVREALGSVLTHKYSEGEPGKRYYEGNENIDKIENLTIKRAKKLFKLRSNWHINVKALSASIANFTVLNAILKPGDTIMSMYLTDGGHISHGWYVYRDKKTNKIIDIQKESKQPASPVGGSFARLQKRCEKIPISTASKFFNVVQYRVNPKTQIFDYEKIAKLAKKVKPKLIISGGTSYPREINYKRLSEIAHKNKAYYMADIAHEAGLIAVGVNKSPFQYADFVTTSTQKTLRGPRGAIIFCKKKFANKIDRALFPGIQGGPFNNNIAAIATCLKEAASSKFKTYAKQIVKNAKILTNELKKYDFKIVSGGTDKHLILIDLNNKKLGPKGTQPIAKKLAQAGLVMNKNTIPYKTRSPFYPSGLRLGTPGITTRGMKEKQMKQIAEWMNRVVNKKENPKIIFQEVKKLTKRFPYKN